MTRDELQERAAFTLQNTKRLICQWATGTGKSRVVLKFIENNPGITTLILVPEKNNIDNWYQEFDKFGVSTVGVTVACYASYHKYKNTDWGLLVFDEAPHINTDLKLDVCSSVTGEYVLALGAVLTEEERLSLESIYGSFVLSRISLAEAIRQGYVRPPTICILHLEMDNINRVHKHNGRILTAKEKYDALQDTVKQTVNAYGANATEWNKMRMLRAGNVRKRFLGEQKTEAMGYLCQKLREKNKRFLCFCASIQQAEHLGKDKAFTSESPAAANHIERFNNHEIDSLYVVGKLIEGQNLRDIDAGIIGQLGGTERITIQSIGRILRGDKPIIYVPVFDDTKDMSFLYTLTANIPMEYIKHYNFKYNY